MKIKTQFIICILVFSLVLIVIAASVAITEQQVSQLKAQEEISNSIERGASSLNSVSIDYFLYQEDVQLARWQNVLLSLSNDLSRIKPSNVQQQTVANNVAGDLEGLNDLFDDLVSYLKSAPRDVSVRIDPAFQFRWSSMAAESRDLAFDASQLSVLLDNEAHQLNDANIVLIVSLVATFGAFLATIYLMVFRRTLKSVSDLQHGIDTIGSGNLDYAIEIGGKNEITELSHAFNQMTANLKAVTASKTDLEREINVRECAEAATLRHSSVLSGINTIFQGALNTKTEEDLGEICLTVAKEITQSKFGFIDEIKDGKLQAIAISNPGWTACNKINLGDSLKIHGIYGRVISSEKGFFTNDPASHPDSVGLPQGHPPLTAFLGVPLIREGQTIGMIAMGNRESGYTQDELVSLEALAPAIVEAFMRKRAETKLRESEQRWSTTLASIGDAVIATDLSGKIMFMNGIAEGLTGWTLSEASQKPVKEVFNIANEQTRLEVEDPVSKVLEKGIIVGLANHTILIKKDGSEVAIDDSGAPIKDKEGKITGVVLIFRDITERRKAEAAIWESEERFSKAFHNSPVPQIITRFGDWRYVDANESVALLLGYTREELIGHTSEELNLIAPDKREQGVQTVNERGELCNFETDVRTKSGKIITVLASTETITLNGQRHLINTFIDVTLRKQMQAKLEEYSKHLEELVDERTKQLKDAERLAAIGATAGMVGHDIRNPLQAITGDVYLAKTELADIPESLEKKNVLESLQEIEKNIEYINKIVADLQDFARPLKPHLEETDLKLVINELLAKNHLPENIDVRVKVESKARKVVADASYLNRILYNLVTNAVQAMPTGGKLDIHVFRDKKTKEEVLTVADTGVGIPEAVKGKLFTPMFTTKSKGQGFGLAVIKRMAEALNGNVVFESREGDGTKFIIRIPQNPKKEKAF